MARLILNLCGDCGKQYGYMFTAKCDCCGVERLCQEHTVTSPMLDIFAGAVAKNIKITPATSGGKE